MPWSYDPSRPPAERFQEWEHPDQPPAPPPATWPGSPRHALPDGAARQPLQLAAEQDRADRVRAELIAQLRDALARLEQL